jgi:hypothetical protein
MKHVEATRHLLAQGGKDFVCGAGTGQHDIGVLFRDNVTCGACLTIENKRHIPGIAQRKDGSWGVFCHHCSEEFGDYVYPCLAGLWKQAPPPVLFEGEPGE